MQGLDVRVLETVEGLSPVAGGVLLGAIEPSAGKVLALDQGAGRMSSRPVLRARDEAFLAAVREEVFQPRDLRLLLITDDDRLIPS
jgi:hypothetical protein